MPERPRRLWTRAVPSLARYSTRTMPWAALVAGCASGTAVLALLAHYAGNQPLSQDTVRVTILPAVAALAFIPHVHFRPLIQTTPVPTWVTPAAQTLLALPIIAVTCWLQLRLMASTTASGPTAKVAASYPLLAQISGLSMLMIAIAACCERTRYAALSGAIASPVGFAVIAIAWLTPALKRHLVTPFATPQAATLAWCAITGAALALACLAVRDQWQRYTRGFHHGKPDAHKHGR